MSVLKELEKLEAEEKAKQLREAPHVLHPAGGLTDKFVYEPVALGKYVYKTVDGEKGFANLKVEYEDEEQQRHPHWFIEIAGVRWYFKAKPPKEFLFDFPPLETVEKWVKGERQSLSTEQLWKLNGVYLRTFLDFPRPFEFSVVQLFVQQSWLSEILPVVFYLGVKGEFGGGKTVTGESVVLVCRHGYFTGNCSPPFVARAIQDHKITLMVDELDTVAGTKDSDLNSIFRQGYRRGLKYSRVNPDTLETESYEVFGPKLFTVHSEIEEALQTRTVPIHVRETSDYRVPIVNLDKYAFGRFVYTENFLWYLDNILTFKTNHMHSAALDTLDILDLFFSDYNVEIQEEEIRKTLFEKRKTLLRERQVSQVSQVSGRNTELLFLCFAISNLVGIQCDNDVVKTFQQKLIEEGERTEIGYLGVLRQVLTDLWIEKKDNKDYITEDGLVKISNKEIYDKYNQALKKEYGQGVSPATFKEFMLEFGFSDALNRTKLEVPIPGDPEKKSRLCNIFTERVLRKLGIDTEKEAEKKETSLKLEDLKAVYWTDKPLTEKECGVCGYVKPTVWQGETVRGDVIPVCEDCVMQFEKLRKVGGGEK
ncbi:MAG: hypothetical protein DRN12_06740 [Thermoplasmata archaeon]|nr:MAG: hypothetical protein DRN12_06740 [Thermoplasmata archaeon]